MAGDRQGDRGTAAGASGGRSGELIAPCKGTGVTLLPLYQRWSVEVRFAQYGARVRARQSNLGLPALGKLSPGPGGAAESP